ncbi:hypothetical protein PS1_042801 [Malus domestica]|uniref:uncharacterized protein n=1 Tax=Malus domestica TaxID=3750 RepID=UPI0010AA5642|nr:uncharacterized protein LOC114821224 isoform X1 [Malus domestica]XP_028951077.1 uncharacterized protein LOC114821818 isoform X1 [Malus domestica]
MSSRAVEDDALAKTARAVEALYLLRDTYFSADPDDKISRLNIDSDLALNLLDSIPLGTDNEAELVDESIQHAKEAITLDVKDGNSLCIPKCCKCLKKRMKECSPIQTYILTVPLFSLGFYGQLRICSLTFDIGIQISISLLS